jgi:hypothetical protein
MRFEPKYSGLAISCGDESYSVHRCVVCTQSGLFAKACDGVFMVKDVEDPDALKRSS